jgi:hypothetical protein
MEETEVEIRPPVVRVQIDLNARSRDGYVRARLSRADGPLVLGDEILAYEPEDRIAAPALVKRVDYDRGFVYLEVDWDQMDDDPAYGRVLPMFPGVVSLVTNAAAAVSMRLRGSERVRAVGFIGQSEPCQLATYEAAGSPVRPRLTRAART